MVKWGCIYNNIYNIYIYNIVKWIILMRGCGRGCGAELGLRQGSRNE